MTKYINISSVSLSALDKYVDRQVLYASNPCRYSKKVIPLRRAVCLWYPVLRRENVGLGRCSPEEVEQVLNVEGFSDLFAK